MLDNDSQSLFEKSWDIVVIGGGNAGVCAAITAAERGCSILVIETAPREFRGGNTRHTRNLRSVHDEPTDVMSDRYTFEEYWDDLMRVTKGVTNEHLAKLTLESSQALMEWLIERGVRFQTALSGTLNLNHTNAFFLGGGRAMLNSLCRHAESVGVQFIYEAEVTDIALENGFCESVDVSWQGQSHHIRCKQLITAAGGFEADLDWLAEGWGDAAKNFLVRGTPYNKGRVLRVLLDRGAQPVGALDQCHAVAIDARAPKYDGGIASRVDGVPFGVVLNNSAERFYDEGEDFWPKRYAIWGRLVAAQPDQIAYAIVDSEGVERFMPSVFTPIVDDTIEGLASQLGIDPTAAKKTIDAFNAACPSGPIDQMILDGKATTGLTPEKTNWSAPLQKPPFYGYPLRPGITFTYMGVAVNDRAQVLMQDGKPAANLFAAGEIMAGNVLGQGYLGGIGMTIGGVFGRIAGAEAARVLNR
ncbi:MAG: FAD-dependent tricarballylate dehydrogenase TcuA [Alphaproteobacteria bacterium]|jgi:tricarballylate dehydrogenase|nr:FAD-dependent tricarballylate dehydrogenase TcuA [Alphaproteobacteria bacterium]NDG36680.1 FAD-dependent tricarballylate dehydrogenase TcuA [Alphaproteobacteria bacterium]